VSFTKPFFTASIMCLMLLTGCNAKDKGMNELPEISASIKKQLAFTCAHEKGRIPPRDPEAEQLYKHARWIVKNNILKRDPAVYPAVERLVRIATAYGHDKANIELRGMLQKSQAVSADPVNEVIDLVQDLIKRGIPAGYYDMGWYLQQGYGVRADRELGFKHYRKAADLGNPEGQYLVGDILSDEGKNGAEIASIGWAMYRCAADQLHAKAADELAIHLKNADKFAEALNYFQLGSSAGMDTSADRLSSAFAAKGNEDVMYRLDQAVDAERERRYRVMSRFLSSYEYLNPRVPEINDIVPLPPAKLPPWDGKFKWLEEHKANVAPPLPTEQRIAEMARAKGLDPKNWQAVARRPVDCACASAASAFQCADFRRNGYNISNNN
jgi:uncharacterized protein